MFESLANYVMSLPEEKLPELTLEDMALCLAWHDSHRDTPEKQQPYAPLVKKAEQWARVVAPPTSETEGHRQQPLLRELIDAAQLHGIENLKLDEVDFLYFAWTLTQRAGAPEILERPASLLKQYVPHWQERREDVIELSPGMPSVAERLMVFTPEDLRTASARDVPNFGGIVPYRGPLLFYQGNAKILGGVPEGNAVNIEGGYCCVSGLVIGLVAATGDCDVRDNISGVVVSRKGHLRTATLLNQCTAIAKEGQVRCYGAEDPRLVFGGAGVTVRTNTLGGVLMGQSIEVEGEVDGGELSATDTITAQLFKNTERRLLAIVLRRVFSCRDYGEILNAEASRMLSSITRFQQRLTNIAQMEELCAREADEFAGNVLFYLFGETDTTHRIQEIEKLRGRLAFINRLRAGAELFAAAAEEQLNMPVTQGAQSESRTEPGATVEREMIESLRMELMKLAQEARIDRDLYNDQEEILHEGGRLQRVNRPRADILKALQKLTERVESLGEKAADMEAGIAQRETALEAAIGRTAILERAKESRTRVAVVEQLIEAGRHQKNNELLRRRVKDRYVTLMRRNIQNRLSSVTTHQMNAQEIGEKLDKLRKKLWVEYQISIPQSIEAAVDAHGAKVTGRFDEGVRICAWRHLVDVTGESAAGMRVTEDSGDEVQTYRRSPRGSIILDSGQPPGPAEAPPRAQH